MTYKIVQLTDTHLFRTPDQNQKGVNTYESLAAVVDDVARSHADFDALLLTGDLSQDETPESYDMLVQLLAPIRGAPVHAIPGNHEDLSLMQTRLGAAGMFVLSDVALGPWKIIMLNSQVRGQVGGEIGAEQQSILKRTIRETEGHIIIAVHHPPLPIQSAWIDALRLVDGETLLEGVSDPPVKAVVCGHVHQAYETNWRGTSILTTPSTCVQFKPYSDEFAIDEAAPGYRVFQLEDSGGWSTEVRRIAI